MGVFLGLWLVWQFVGAFIGWALDLDRERAWWKGVGAIVVAIAPLFLAAFLAKQTALVYFGERASNITLRICIALIILDCIAYVLIFLLVPPG